MNLKVHNFSSLKFIWKFHLREIMNWHVLCDYFIPVHDMLLPVTLIVHCIRHEFSLLIIFIVYYNLSEFSYQASLFNLFMLIAYSTCVDIAS